MSKGDPTAAKANKELGEQGHLVRENTVQQVSACQSYLVSVVVEPLQ